MSRLRRQKWLIPVLALVVTVVGLLLRLVGVTGIPTGFHGDEAIIGMEGQRILREGLIAPYSWTAHGQPSGPMYLTALTVQLFDNTVFAVRLSSVIFGTLAIPALFWVVRRHLDSTTALVSASLLAVMTWHILYSRIGFPVAAWPLVVILAVGAVAMAARRQTVPAWALGGALAGLGIYAYNAHPAALAIISLFAGLSILSNRWRIGWPEVRNGLAYAGGMIVVLLPMIWYALANFDRYWTSVTRHSVRQQDEWQGLDGPVAQAGYILEHYLRFWWELAVDPPIDYVDAAGVVEIIPPLLLVPGLVGMVIALLRRRSPLVMLSAMIVLLMPVTTAVTLAAEQRRTVILAPFLALFLAIGVVEIVRWTGRFRRPALTWAVALAVSALLLAGVAIDLRNYYVEYAESPVQHWVFAEPFADATHYMRELDDDRYVYFLADRWSIDYQPRQFLAPQVRGEDRSEEFGVMDLAVDRNPERPVFILVGDYQPLLDDLRDRYPGGEVVRGGDREFPTFTAYELP